MFLSPPLRSTFFRGSVLQRVWGLWDLGMGSFLGKGWWGELGGEHGHPMPPGRVWFSSFPAEQMDELLQRCFLHALKCRVKKADLPLLTSTFLGSHVFSCWYGRHGVGRSREGLGPTPWWWDRTGLVGASVEGHAEKEWNRGLMCQIK